MLKANKSILYSNAIISVRHNRMLNLDRIRRMVVAPDAMSAAKVLFECGYDESLIAHNADREDLILDTERERMIRDFRDLCPSDDLLYACLIRYDYHNAANFYKAFHLNTPGGERDAIYPFGYHDPAVLRGHIQKGNYHAIPGMLGETLGKLGVMRDITPCKVDIEMEKALYADKLRASKGVRNSQCRAYFQADAAFTNMRTVAKARFAGRDYADMLVACGTLSPAKYSVLYRGDAKTIKDAFVATDYLAVASALADGFDGKNLDAFEAEATKHLVSLSKVNCDDAFSINMVFNWFIMKQEELKVVKTILIGKKFGFTNEHLRDQLKGAYEIFR